MGEDILDAYRRILGAYAVPFDAIAAPEDWHLSLFVVPSFEPEQIFDIDYRAGRALFYRTRLLPSLWEALWNAKENRGKVAPVSAERACIDLRPDNPLVSLVRAEHLFRMEGRDTLGCDGATYTLVHAYHGGTRRLEAWEAPDLPQWARLLDAVREAEAFLPRR